MTKDFSSEPILPGAPRFTGNRGYLLAIIGLTVALALRGILDSLWGDRVPFVSFVLAELVVFRLAGTGPLIVTTLGGFVLADWFFILPRHSLLIGNPINVVNTGFFFAISSVLLVLGIRERRALERERATRQQLLQSTRELARLAAIVEFSDDAIIGKSLDGTVLSWNGGAERLYGYTSAEAVGKPISMLVPTEGQAEFQELLQKVHRGERVEHLETMRKAQDGRDLAVSLRISPVRDADGKIVGASTIARDVTERKQAEVERERLVKDLKAALANVKTLRGLLPICASCKKIRDDKGYWNQIEFYIRERSDASFTHGICPDCAERSTATCSILLLPRNKSKDCTETLQSFVSLNCFHPQIQSNRTSKSPGRHVSRVRLL